MTDKDLRDKIHDELWSLTVAEFTIGRRLLILAVILWVVVLVVMFLAMSVHHS